MVDVERVAEIARGLSEAQREWIAAMPSVLPSMSPEDWDAMPPLHVETPAGRAWFAHAMASHRGDGGPWILSAQLTPLGVAVRDHLRDQQGASGNP